MTKIVHVGLGAIGKTVAGALLEREGAAELSAVVEANPAMHGKDLGEVLGRPVGRKIPIVATIAEARAAAPGAQVAIMTTGSRMVDVKGTLEELADAGLHVVSSCEELAYPKLRNPELTAELDAYARGRKVAILGTGVNPGFAMDAFAMVLSSACTKVTGITCVRSLDARKRRFQLQKKVAAGMTMEEFERELKQRKIGHVGLAESAALLAEGFGWKLDDVDERFFPVVAERAVASEHFKIAAGQVRGMRMTAVGTMGARKVVELDLTMAFEAETFDEIRIAGNPPIAARITTGFPGDHATVALLVNCAQAVARLEPGMRTMLDMLPLRSVGG